MIAKARIWSVKLRMVREGQKCSEGVQKSSCTGHECWNMHSEPGVAHQHEEKV